MRMVLRLIIFSISFFLTNTYILLSTVSWNNSSAAEFRKIISVLIDLPKQKTSLQDLSAKSHRGPL